MNVGSPEFSMINAIFKQLKRDDPSIIINVGDDAAVTCIPPGFQLVSTMDTLVSNVHFFSDIAPTKIAHKALAVNLSDIAAMGAMPTHVLIALTMPENDPAWLNEFCRGLTPLLDKFNVQVIGGDLAKGPLSISIQAQGIVPNGKAVCRNGAVQGDRIFVTNSLGGPAYALHCLEQGHPPERIDKNCLAQLHSPLPRVAAGQKLLGVANSMIDISDGALSDLAHILAASNLAAVINVDDIPVPPVLQGMLKLGTPSDTSFVRHCALNGGDDYELLFTVEKERVSDAYQLMSEAGEDVTCIGEIVESHAAPSILCVDSQGKRVELAPEGYQHF